MKTHPVPAVRLILSDKEGRVLFVKRAHSSYAEGSWCLPGGKIDYGKTVEQAVIEELKEETSLTCDQAIFLFYQDSLPLNPGEVHCINMYFECVYSGTVSLNEESSDYAWIGPPDFEKYTVAFGNDRGIKRYWEQRSTPGKS